MFVPCSDVAAAQWIATSDEPWWDLVTLGPSGFSGYAKLRYIPDPAYEGQSEHECAQQNGALPAGSLSETEQLRIAVGALLQHTSTPTEGYLLVWDGYGDNILPTTVLHSPRVVLPDREYYLCRVPLPDFVSGAVEATWEAEADLPLQPPAFIWSSDRAWCVTSDIDPHWAGIGADLAAIDSLLTELRLDVIQAERGQKLPFYQ
jgi:hypothetical protein